MTAPHPIEAALAPLLDAMAQPGYAGRFTPSRLRENILEYLRAWDEEGAGFPDAAADPHWDLWMADFGDPHPEGFFVAAVFVPEGIELFCGRGDSYDVRTFTESEFPDDPRRLFAEMSRRFPLTRPLPPLPRPDAEAWLGRTFPPTAGA